MSRREDLVVSLEGVPEILEKIILEDFKGDIYRKFVMEEPVELP